MSETKLCIECKHHAVNHDSTMIAPDVRGFCAVCRNQGLLCSRTYESLVGEKGKTQLTMKPADPSMPIPVGENHPVSGLLMTSEQYAVFRGRCPHCNGCTQKDCACLEPRCDCGKPDVSEWDDNEELPQPQIRDDREPDPCPCQSWTGRADWIDAHHPNCDGKGNRKQSVAEQWEGIFTEALGGAVLGVRDAKPEPTLSLLIIDLGDSCVVKVEKGDKQDVGLHVLYWQDKITGICGMPFPELRAAIDGEKPTPRIEPDQKGDLRLVLFAGQQADKDNPNQLQIVSGDYDALSTLAGKPLPIYNGGAWEEVGHIDDDVYNNTDLRVWRYSR